MRGLPLVFFVALIPALAALGHDVYLFYANYGIDSIQRDVQQQIADKGADSFFASLGFLWTRYSPDSYKLIAESVEEKSWAYINLLLTQKAVFVGIAFAAFVTLLAAILRMLGIGSGEDSNSGKWGQQKKSELGLRERGGKFKYKRK